MNKFGLLKSKIEKLLIESYVDKTLPKKLKFFKKNILENKNISKLFYLYDELNSKKGLKKDLVDDYINECVRIFENTINKLKSDDFIKIQLWVESSEVVCENEYHHIDNLFFGDITKLETKIESRKFIKENLQKEEKKDTKEILNLPISSMVSIANKTIQQHIENLNESEKKEFFELLNTKDEELNEKFSVVKEETLEKLKTLIETAEDDLIKEKIEETIKKVENETFDKVSYIKMKNLRENL